MSLDHASPKTVLILRVRIARWRSPVPSSACPVPPAYAAAPSNRKPGVWTAGPDTFVVPSLEELINFVVPATMPSSGHQHAVRRTSDATDDCDGAKSMSYVSRRNTDGSGADT